MAITVTLSVEGQIYCDQRSAIINDVIDITLDVTKFPTATAPIPGTIVGIAKSPDGILNVACEVVGGTIYSVSIDEVDLPDDVGTFDNCDVAAIECQSCCARLQEQQLSDSLLKWSAGEDVETGWLRVNPNGSIISSNSDRTTGPTYDGTEEAEWTILNNHDQVNLPNIIVANSIDVTSANKIGFDEQFYTLDGMVGSAMARQWISPHGDDSWSGGRFRPKKTPNAAWDALLNSGGDTPVGVLKMYPGVFDDFPDPLVSTVNQIWIEGHGPYASGGSSRLEYQGTGDAIYIQPVGQYNGHGLGFRNFSIKVPDGSDSCCFNVDAGAIPFAENINSEGGRACWRFTGTGTNFLITNCTAIGHRMAHPTDPTLRAGGYIVIEPDPVTGNNPSNFMLSCRGLHLDYMDQILYYKMDPQGTVNFHVQDSKVEGLAQSNGNYQATDWKQYILIDSADPPTANTTQRNVMSVNNITHVLGIVPPDTPMEAVIRQANYSNAPSASIHPRVGVWTPGTGIYQRVDIESIQGAPAGMVEWIYHP